MMLICQYLQYQWLSETHNAIFSALELVPDYLALTALRFSLITAGLVFLFISLRKGLARFSLSGFVLILIGELLGRTLFYSLHMTVGLKALGG